MTPKANQIIAKKDKEINLLEQKIKILEERVKQLTHLKFGASSEKYNPDQDEMVFDEAENPEVFDEQLITEEPEMVEVPAHKRKKSGRTQLSDDLPRVEVVYDLDDDEKFCKHEGCGGHALHQIGEEVSEQLEIIPAKAQVKRTIRLKYACRCCEQGIKTAKAPKQPIPKSIASPSLLAGIVTNKYQDALPLYRQQVILKRIGVELPRATLANWMIKCGELLIPLINLLRDRLLESHLVHMDETPIQVLNEPDKLATSQSYMWVQRTGVHDHPVVLFDYSPSRSAKVPIELLHDYQGLLQADGYAGYQQVVRDNGLILLGCWAHARRKFDTALKATKVKKGKAQFALSEIQKLYRIESQIKGKTSDEVKQIRQELAKPIVDKLRIWLDKSLNQVPPKSLTGKALYYLNNQWDHLTAYLDNGYAAIDNNRAENAIRPFVIGRKNWLFANSVKGAKASSILYSIVETAKANDVEPWHYLNHVFKELPNANLLEDIEKLLPWNVQLQ